MSETWTSSSPYSWELLADYAEGLLNPATADAIAAHLENHPIDSEIVAGIRGYLARDGATREGLEAWLETTYQRRTSDPKKSYSPPKIILWYKILSVAAAVAMLVVAGWWLWLQQNDLSWPQQANAWLQEEAYPAPTPSRSPSADTAEAWAQQAALAYEQQNWPQAMAWYDSLQTHYPTYDSLGVAFYGAVAALHSGSPTLTTAVTLQHLAEGQSSYRAPAAYYQVIFALLQDHTEEAHLLAIQALQAPEVYRRSVLEEVASE